MTIKATYTLDPGTVRAIEDMARKLGISKSEALRRAVRLAAAEEAGTGGALDALGELQRRLGLKPSAARAWAARVRAERRASSARREPSGR